jgi:septal ring factor EnvC (AmiA/AmiB activator)
MLRYQQNVSRWLCGIGLVLLLGSYATPSPKNKFQQDRQVLMKKIDMINTILAQTESKKKANTGQLNALRKKASTNHAVIHSLSKEVKRTNQKIHDRQQQINNLQNELLQLKKEYSHMLFLGTKSMRDINLLVFIFSADSFQELLQRLRTTEQYIKIRKRHFKEIQQVNARLKGQLMNLEKQVGRKHTLLSEKKQEQEKLATLRQRRQQVIQDLEQERGRLLKELTRQREAVGHLDKLISDLIKKEIEAASAHSAKPIMPPLSAAAKALAAAFMRQRSKLPWPVKAGFISNKFGTSPHPILKNIQIENLGIDIQTQEKAEVLAIFKGTVKTISFVPGMHRVIIIQHGNCHTVYAKLESVIVKAGQEVEAGTPLGVIYTDPDGVSTLQFQIWQDGQKVNPATWLAKEPHYSGP